MKSRKIAKLRSKFASLHPDFIRFVWSYGELVAIFRSGEEFTKREFMKGSRSRKLMKKIAKKAKRFPIW